VKMRKSWELAKPWEKKRERIGKGPSNILGKERGGAGLEVKVPGITQTRKPSQGKGLWPMCKKRVW